MRYIFFILISLFHVSCAASGDADAEKYSLGDQVEKHSNYLGKKVAQLDFAQPVSKKQVIEVFGDDYDLTDHPVSGIVYYDEAGKGIMFCVFDFDAPYQFIDYSKDLKITGIYVFENKDKFLDGKTLMPSKSKDKSLREIFSDIFDGQSQPATK